MTTAHSRDGAPPKGGRARGGLLGRIETDRRGASAVEFALIGPIFIVLLINVVDFAILIWSRMQVDYAAAAGAQAAYNRCQTDLNCRSNWTAPVTTAAQSTSLGTDVSAIVSERYFCTVNATLQPQEGLSPPPPTLPTNCSAQGDPNTKPADYVTVSVNYIFNPVIAGPFSFIQSQPLTAMAMQSLQ